MFSLVILLKGHMMIICLLDLLYLFCSCTCRSHLFCCREECPYKLFWGLFCTANRCTFSYFFSVCPSSIVQDLSHQNTTMNHHQSFYLLEVQQSSDPCQPEHLLTFVSNANLFCPLNFNFLFFAFYLGGKLYKMIIIAVQIIHLYLLM